MHRIVERRPVTVLTVYTGDPTHKVHSLDAHRNSYLCYYSWVQIIVTVLKPAAHLTPREVDAELKLSVQQLRKDGARLKQVPWWLCSLLAALLIVCLRRLWVF